MIYLTPEELKEIEGRHMVGTYQSLYRDIADVASEKSAWGIYDFCKKYHDDRSHWFGLLEAIKKYLTEQGIKREAACNKCNSVGEYLECYDPDMGLMPKDLTSCPYDSIRRKE